jgi:hypothetical protein
MLARHFIRIKKVVKMMGFFLKLINNKFPRVVAGSKE